MSDYVQLDCLNCQTSLSFGKPILKDSMLTLRLFSESQADWVDGNACWKACQLFLFQHMNHHLVFRKDDSFEAQDMARLSNYDALMQTHAKSLK